MTQTTHSNQKILTTIPTKNYSASCWSPLKTCENAEVRSTVSSTLLWPVDMRMRDIFFRLSSEDQDVNYLGRILSLSGSTAGWNSDKKLPQWHFRLGWQFDWDKLTVVLSGRFTRCAMDFNVKRLAADAGTFLSRAVQVSLTVSYAGVVDNQRQLLA